MKKIVVKEELCIGCGACVAIDGDHFDFNADGLASAISQENIENTTVAEAVESCPTDAISIEEGCTNEACKCEACNCNPCECTEEEHNCSCCEGCEC